MATGHLRGYIEHYFVPHPSRQMKELLASRAILDFATGAVMIFEPLYLYSNGFTPVHILLFYAALYATYFLLLPLGGKICRRHGYEHTILFSSPFLIIWFLTLFSIPRSPWVIPVAILALATQKILYWPGYHANFAASSDEHAGARGISTMAAIGGLSAIAAPAIGGLVVSTLGYKPLFIGVAVLILLSNLPLLRTPELYMPQPFPYAPAMRRLFAPRNRRMLLAFMGFGEELIALTIWPIYLAVTVPGAVAVGAVTSFAMLANVLATLYVGRVSDDGDRVAVLRSGSLYTAASWLVRIFAAGGFGAFLVDAFYRVSKNMVNVPLLATLYGDAKNGQVMDAIVFFEMALSLGKIAAALLGAAAFAYIPGTWAPIFVIAAVFTLFFAAVRRDEKPSYGTP